MSRIHPRRSRVAAATATLLSASVLAIVSPGQVANADRAWGPEQDIGAEVAPSDGRESAVVRVRGNRTAVAAWVERDDGRVTVARRGPGGRWTTPRAVSEKIGRYAAYDLAVAKSGLASVVWERRVDGTAWVEESHLERGTWTVPVRLGRGREPEVIVDGTGTTTVVWRKQGLRVARRTEAGTWRTSRAVAAGPVSGLELAANPDGDLVLAWKGRRTAGTVRTSVRLHGRNHWTAPVTVGRGPYVTSMAAAVDGSGRALVLWTVVDIWNEQQHDYRNYVAWVRSDPQGQWSKTRKLTRQLGEEGGDVGLAMNNRGHAVATWAQIHRTDSPAVLWAARFDPHGTWAAPTRLSKSTWGAERRAWMDRSGVARVLTNSRAIWQFSQRPGAGWTGRKLNHGRLIDAHGAGSRLVMLFHRRAYGRTVWSRTLDLH